MNQTQMFYQSHCMNASGIHLKMAELQEKAGRHDLARDSKKTALARRISGRTWHPRYTFAQNAAWGEQVVNNIKGIFED